MPHPSETIQIQNVVASTGIGQELDLESVAEDLAGSQYDPDQFPGLIYRIQDPKAALLIFRSGKIVCTGAQSEAAVEAAVDTTTTALADLGIPVEDSPEVTVQNIVSSASFGQHLNLNAVAVGLGLEQIEYEPEQFPSLVYRLDEPAVVILLFASGKTIITGATGRAMTVQAVETVHDRLLDLNLIDT